MEKIRKFIIEKAKNQSCTLFYEDDNHKIFLHSKYNPEAEAQTILQKFELNKYDFIILLGNGLGYVLNELNKYKHIKKIFIIEEEKKIHEEFLKNKQIPEIENNVFFINQKLVDIVKIIASAFNIMEYMGFLVIDIPSIVKLKGEYYNALKKLLQEELDKRINNQLTQVKLGIPLFNNFYNNIKKIKKINIIKINKNQSKNETAIIVSAGPSLQEDINKLVFLQKSSYIFAADTALPYLIKNNINPDIVFSMDPQYFSYLHFYQSTDNSVKVSDIFGSSSWLLPKKEYAFIISKNFISEAIFNSQDIIDFNGGSITNFIYQYIKDCFKKIIFVGLDLCYTDSNMYIPHSYLNNYFLKQTNKFKSLQLNYLKFYIQRSRRNIVFKTNSYKSTYSMINYYQWLMAEIKGRENVFFSDNCIIDHENLKKINIMELEASKPKSMVFEIKSLKQENYKYILNQKTIFNQIVQLIIMSKYINNWHNYSTEEKSVLFENIIKKLKIKINSL